MPVVIDPDGREVRALQDITDWSGKRLLEIGCGDGRLTLRLAALGLRSIEAIDPDPRLIRRARRSLSRQPAASVKFRVGHAEKLKYPADQFDVVLFAWAL